MERPALQLAYVLLVTLIVEGSRERSVCPSSYGFHPVLIVSLDGFRADYLERGLTPTIQALAESGVHAPYMKTSYPTKTFPNHYTAVTGTYPEFHGIVASTFFDPLLNATFKKGTEEALKSHWWGAEPIWNTLSNQGKKSAAYFWVGSDAEVDGRHPTYWFPYNESVPFEIRVDQVLEWLSMPEETRPSWVGLYFHEPDYAGHWSGAESQELSNQLMIVDIMMKRLLDGLEAQGLLSCINIIVCADHGMARSGNSFVVHLEKYVPNIQDVAMTYQGSFSRISPYDKSEATKLEIMNKLSCQNTFLRVYENEGLPTRYHYSNSPRIDDIVLDLDPGFLVRVDSNFSREGEHGYDNYFKKMNALFLASGPAFKHGLVMEPFQNIEIYNLMCLLAGVEPAPNNGTEGLLYYILKDPPADPVLPDEPAPAASDFPEGDLDALLHISGCDGDLQEPEDWLYSLEFSKSEEKSLRSYHLPWGIPHTGDLPAQLTLLYHSDHITAYSEALKMPLWTSYSVEGVGLGTPPSSWSSDVRLTANNTIKCSDYGHLAPEDIHMAPLFPPVMSEYGSLERIPYLVSNAVPLTRQSEERWSKLVNEFIPKWIVVGGPVNVIMGPVFDNNADSHVDDFTDFGIPEVPSDLFVVLTRCLQDVLSVNHCPHDHLDVLSFIYPLDEPVPNCLDDERYALEFSAKVRDVEMASGLTFYPDLAFRDRVTLEQRITSNLWPFN
ncbi:ectonucleotide pyrophosphatase/phosphodiesterase family member 3-like [Palaemon carinicauda]|uniref:ectonucleotide pyrophosphatase/phosphodiesterase family member 3-like n=1 Tax=Palaemon carinicauda TaxID=392227 RepID=UPI0035B61FE7